MNRHAVACVALAFLGLGGCAGLPERTSGTVIHPGQAGMTAPDRIPGAVTPGRSTRADVLAALGTATVLRFDSGYEVWVYRVADREVRPRTGRPTDERAPARGEFVVLFAPSGIAAKTRLRTTAQPAR